LNVAGAAARFIGAEIYRNSTYGAWHPLAIPRVSTVMDLARALGWLPHERYIVSPRAKPAALAEWHRPDYLAALQRAEARGTVTAAERARYNIGTHSNPVFPEMYRRPATAAGAAILAGEILAEPGTLYSPAGGTHHGMPGRANGFCYLNDPVFAILSLRRSGVRRIAYVDIDAHHPDGVEHAFAADPDVLLVSVHEAGRWPGTGRIGDVGVGQIFNLPVARGFDDTGMAMVCDGLILPAVAAFRPEAIVLQCGADGVMEDPLSRLAMSNNAHWEVVRALRSAAPRLLVLGGGGYNPWTVARLWTGVWATLAGHEIPDWLPEAGRAVLRRLTWTNNSRGRAPPAHWSTTLRDAPRQGAPDPELRADLARLSGRLRAAV
jgi:acetoin utilization protein AcuC